MLARTLAPLVPSLRAMTSSSSMPVLAWTAVPARIPAPAAPSFRTNLNRYIKHHRFACGAFCLPDCYCAFSIIHSQSRIIHPVHCAAGRPVLEWSGETMEGRDHRGALGGACPWRSPPPLGRCPLPAGDGQLPALRPAPAAPRAPGLRSRLRHGACCCCSGSARSPSPAWTGRNGP